MAPSCQQYTLAGPGDLRTTAPEVDLPRLRAWDLAPVDLVEYKRRRARLRWQASVDVGAGGVSGW